MPYDLPEDVGSVTGVRWFLVAVPDDPAYTRAALGAYTDLGHYWKWGLEGPVPTQSDLAAQQWLDAIAETMEALEMGFPDVLLGYIDEVETLLRELKEAQQVTLNCCTNLGPVGDTVGSEIVPGVGDPPATWGDGNTLTTWTDWRGYVCAAADDYVDVLKNQASQMDTLLTVGAVGIGVVGSILGLLAGAGILLAIEYGLAAGVTGGLASYLGSEVFDDTAEDIEAARADIRCAALLGASALRNAVQDAVSTLAWDLFFKWVDYSSAWATMAAGGANGEYLDVAPSTTCAGCTYPSSGLRANNLQFTNLFWQYHDTPQGTWQSQPVPIDFYRPYRLTGDDAGHIGLQVNGVANGQCTNVVMNVTVAAADTVNNQQQIQSCALENFLNQTGPTSLLEGEWSGAARLNGHGVKRSTNTYLVVTFSPYQ